MPTLTVTKTYQDGTALTEAQLDAAYSSIETFVNVTGLGADNIQDNSISSAELQSSSVTESKIATDAVTTTKIADGSVTQAKLIADLQALLVPTGSINAYGGDTAPTGWLMCDGTQVSRTTYAALFALVGVRYGQGNGTTTFHLPDFRGRFLRGVDGGAARDPDAASRTAMNSGGATGSNPGSVQDDVYGSHSHGTQVYTSGSGGLNVGASQFTGGTVSSAPTTQNSGGNETRPKNAYVHFIIKT